MGDNVKNLFQREVENFVVRYQNPSLIDRLLRKSIYLRFENSLSECKKFGYKTVLDVGSGAGIQAAMLANAGLDVLGVDISDNMVQRAKTLTQMPSFSKNTGKLDFRVANFLEFNTDKKFDLVMALGVFDYTKDARTYLAHMKKFAAREVIASFPVAGNIFFPQRWARYKFLKNCDIYAYSHKKLDALASQCQFSSHRVLNTGRDYLFCGYVK
jgi:predicted TPR repeat methyltransferase